MTNLEQAYWRGFIKAAGGTKTPVEQINSNDPEAAAREIGDLYERNVADKVPVDAGLMDAAHAQRSADLSPIHSSVPVAPGYPAPVAEGTTLPEAPVNQGLPTVGLDPEAVARIQNIDAELKAPQVSPQQAQGFDPLKAGAIGAGAIGVPALVAYLLSQKDDEKKKRKV